MRYPSNLTLAKPRAVRFTLAGSCGLGILAKHYGETQSAVIERLILSDLQRLKLVTDPSEQP